MYLPVVNANVVILFFKYFSKVQKGVGKRKQVWNSVDFVVNSSEVSLLYTLPDNFWSVEILFNLM